MDLETVVAVEGPGMLLPDLSPWWEDERRRALLLALIAHLESEPSLPGLGGHLVAVARRPRDAPQ